MPARRTEYNAQYDVAKSGKYWKTKSRKKKTSSRIKKKTERRGRAEKHHVAAKTFLPVLETKEASGEVSLYTHDGPVLEHAHGSSTLTADHEPSGSEQALDTGRQAGRQAQRMQVTHWLYLWDLVYAGKHAARYAYGACLFMRRQGS